MDRLYEGGTGKEQKWVIIMNFCANIGLHGTYPPVPMQGIILQYQGIRQYLLSLTHAVSCAQLSDNDLFNNKLEAYSMYKFDNVKVR